MPEAKGSAPPGVVALLLASGKGSRFDPSGARNKLLQLLPNGSTVIGSSVAHLIAAGLPVTVVAPDDPALRAALAHYPVTWCINRQPELGMGASLALAVSQTAKARGWLVALADMPFIQPASILAVATAMDPEDDPIIAPFLGEHRGHPVGFDARLYPELVKLSGEAGARQLFERLPVRRIALHDYGILRDIDRPDDLLQ